MDPVTFKMAMQLLWSLLKTKKGRRLIVAVTGIIVLGLVAAIAIPAILIAQLTQTTDTALRWRQAVMDGQCVSWNPETEGGRTDGLTSEQVSNARILWEVARHAKFPAQLQSRAAVVAIAAAMQESKLKNLDYGDADSLGILQQRPATGWGTKAQVTDVTKAALAFYGVAEHTHNPGLKQIKGWENMTVTQAAQAVQRSAFPNAYAQWETVARSLVSSFEQTNQVQALTVMTYNLLGSRLYKVKWASRSKYVSRLIHSASPDIIGFQENFSYGKGGRGQARLLDLPGYSWVAPDFRVAIAYKSTLGQVVDQGIIRLGTIGVAGSHHNRFAVWAKINTSAGGLLLVNVHTENGNRDNAARARSRAYDLLLKGLATINPNNALPTVMTGDFNASSAETRPVYRDHLVKLGAAGFFDSATQAAVNSTKISGVKSYNGFGYKIGKKFYTNAIRTGSTSTHIDYIWTAGQVRAVGWQIALPAVTWRTIKGKRVPFASEIGSDHWPVVARVESGAGSMAACDPGMSEATLPGFDGASCVPSHSAAENNIAAVTKRGLRCIASAFPQITSMGGRRSGSDSSCSYSDHCTGYAVDFMVPRWNTAAGRELGWRIARWVQANHKTLRVKYIIWDVKKWNPAANDEWRPYVHPYGNQNPTLAHKDHVHVSFLSGASGN